MPVWLGILAGAGTAIAAFGAVIWAVLKFVMNVGVFLDDVRETRATITKNTAATQDLTSELAHLRHLVETNTRRLDELESRRGSGGRQGGSAHQLEGGPPHTDDPAGIF